MTGLVFQALLFTEEARMSTRATPAIKQKGFTLIEVLVALAIIAIAMSAAVRASGLMTQTSGLLRDKSTALIAAQGRMAELRLQGRLPTGNRKVECDQGRLKLSCEQTVSPTATAHLLMVNVEVRDRSREAPPLAQLSSLVTQE